MRRLYAWTSGAMVAAAVMAGTSAHAAADCHSLAGKRFDDAVVAETSQLTAPVTLASMSARGVEVKAPFCRVEGVITPVPGSYIRFEVWLPPAGAWNGRYQGVGPGGTAGSFPYGPVARALEKGFAVATTDNGHIGSGWQWAVGQPQKIDDWGWRAHHLTAVTAKKVIAAYYGTPAKYAYYLGCSKGGTGAHMEAQRFPEDYDGIVAGAPSNEKMFQVAKNLWTHQILTANPQGRLSPAKLETLNKAVLAACGGLRLGYLEDPDACRYDPGRLLCRGADTDACLTAAQVDIVRKIYVGPVDSSGKPFYVGYPRGSEAGWVSIMGRENHEQAANNDNNKLYIGAFLYGPNNWDVRKLDIVRVMKEASEKYGRSVSAENPDLTPLKARGAKMIGYVGYNDTLVPVGSYTNYYDKVVAKMGGLAQVDSFFRLFLAPGMGHCGGGSGPNSVGQSDDDAPPVRDAQHDIMAALQAWVEEGRAPDKLIATRYIDDNPAKGVAAQRPWCPYPQAARYTRGDPTQAASYVCETPRKR